MDVKQMAGLNYLEVFYDEKAPTMVMMHGFGANMHDLYPLHQAFGQSMNWYFPDGPVEIPMGPFMVGKAWFPIDMAKFEQAVRTDTFDDVYLQDPKPEFLRSIELMEDFIETLLEKIEGPLYLGGFSQGSMMAMALTLKHPEWAQKLVLLSSSFISKQLLTLKKEGHPDLKIFQSHGDADPVLPITSARRLKDMFVEYNYTISYHEFSGGHEIPPEVFMKLREFMGLS